MAKFTSGVQWANESLNNTVLAMVLAGGRGTRLGELTDWRVKPAVPFGGKYRIIDFTLSNCVNSGIRRIGVLTQYKSQSLIRHITLGWQILNPEFGEFIESIPAQQRLGREWYQGTADALYQNKDFIQKNASQYTLILSGDHIYKMNYNHILRFHQTSQADITIACIPVPKEQGSAFGILAVDENNRVTGFEEKPEQPAGIPEDPKHCLASMGIYVFNTQALLEILEVDHKQQRSSHDFGHDVLTYALNTHTVYAWPFRNQDDGEPGYWRDVGTVDSYYQAGMDLISVTPKLNLYEPHWPIRSKLIQHPPAKFVFNEDNRRGMAVDSLVAEGSIVSGTYVKDSLIFTSAYLMDSYIERSIILPKVWLHPGCRIYNAIIDKNCEMPAGTTIGVDPTEDRKWYHVTGEGVVLVTSEMVTQRKLS